MAVARVLYRERQRLLTADFIAEQTYRLGVAGRHYLGPHDWGVVRGLRLVRIAGAWFLDPGLAIDGYGREIVVPQQVAVPDLDDDACVSLILYYCEFPEQLDPVRCVVDPAPRIGHRFRLAPFPDFLQSVTEPDVASGRAAGAVRGLPPWPVLIGRIGTKCFDAKNPAGVPSPPVDYSHTRYVRHRAGAFRTPTGRASMQLGPLDHADIYHFLLSTRTDAGKLEKRVGVDRDDTIRVWRPLIIMGPAGAGAAQVSAQAIIHVSGPMPTRPLARVLVEGRLRPGDGNTLPVLTTAFIEQGGVAPRIAATEFKRTQALTAAIHLSAGDVANIALLEGSKPIPAFVRPEGARTGARMQPLFESFAVEMKPVGGKLIMRGAAGVTEQVEPLECGDVSRVRPGRASVGPPVVRFVPGKGLTPNPIMREVYALPIESDVLVPRTELLISGGPQDDTDVHPRFGVGGRDNGTWLPGVSMNGQGKLVMGRPLEPGDTPGTAVKVEGTVYLPPVGKNDPLLPVLMAQAFMAGLLQMGQVSTEVALSFSNLPAKITKTEDFDYKLTVKRNVGVQLVKIKKCLEIIKGVQGGNDVVINDVSALLPGELNDNNGHDATIPHQAFTIAATKVRITIQLLIGIGTATRVVELTSAKIPVVAP